MVLPDWKSLKISKRFSLKERWDTLVTEVNRIGGLVDTAVDNDTIYDDSDVWTALGISKSDLESEDFVPLADRVPSVDVGQAIEDLLDEAIESETPQPRTVTFTGESISIYELYPYANNEIDVPNAIETQTENIFTDVSDGIYALDGDSVGTILTINGESPTTATVSVGTQQGPMDMTVYVITVDSTHTSFEIVLNNQ